MPLSQSTGPRTRKALHCTHEKQAGRETLRSSMDCVLRTLISEYDVQKDYSIYPACPKEAHVATNASCKLPVQKAEKIHADDNVAEKFHRSPSTQSFQHTNCPPPDERSQQSSCRVSMKPHMPSLDAMLPDLVSQVRQKVDPGLFSLPADPEFAGGLRVGLMWL